MNEKEDSLIEKRKSKWVLCKREERRWKTIHYIYSYLGGGINIEFWVAGHKDPRASIQISLGTRLLVIRLPFYNKKYAYTFTPSKYGIHIHRTSVTIYKGWGRVGYGEDICYTSKTTNISLKDWGLVINKY